MRDDLNFNDWHRPQLTPSQHKAIEISHNIAEGLSDSMIQQIISYYRMGSSQKEIAELLLPEEYRKSPKVATGAVHLTIGWYMDLAERELIRGSRLSEGGRRLGALSADGTYGFKGISEKSRREIGNLGRQVLADKIASGEIDSSVFIEGGRKGGRKAAVTNRSQGTGIFGLSDENRKEIASKTGKRMRDEARGIFRPELRTPEVLQARADAMLEKTGKQRMLPGEKELLMELVEDSEYIRSSGKRIGTPNYPKIQAVLKEKFGIERTIKGLRSVVYRERKKR